MAVAVIDLPMSRLVSLAGRGRLNKPFGCVVCEGSPPIPTRVFQYSKAGVIGQPLIIAFHGAFDRSRRKDPVFAGKFLLDIGPIDATVVSFLDPSLIAFADLGTGWYLGHAGHRVVDELATLIATLVRRIRPSRLIFTGGSAGAHPALVHSSRFRDSVCVVVNPQTCASRAAARHVRNYRQTCWPHLVSTAPISSIIPEEDVASRYRADNGNTVVYLQNSEDDLHVRSHMLPFLGALPHLNRLLLRCTCFEGIASHSFPLTEWRRWVVAALSAPSLEQHAILAAYSSRVGAAVGDAQASLMEVQTPAAKQTATQRRDLEIAAVLAARARPLTPETTSSGGAGADASESSPVPKQSQVPHANGGRDD